MLHFTDKDKIELYALESMDEVNFLPSHIIPQPISDEEAEQIRAKQVNSSRGDDEQLKAEAHAAINTWRDKQEEATVTFEYAGHTWDASLKTRERLRPALNLEQLPNSFFWTDADNNDVPMTKEELVVLDKEHETTLAQQGFKIHTRQREMKQQIQSMTREELLVFTPSWAEVLPISQ